MTLRYVLVDFENVQPTNLGALKLGDCHIKIFAGANQKNVDIGLAKALQPFGDRAEYIQISGNGKDALDFHIAFYIGRLSAQSPGASFSIVSKDTGFDPLVEHLALLGIQCQRLTTTEGGSASAPTKTSVVAAKAATKTVAKKATAAPKMLEKPSSGGRTTLDSRTSEVLHRLAGMKVARPATVSTLRSSIKSWFKPALPEIEVSGLFDQLVRQGSVKVSGTKITYALES